jgi:hypothetical protein
MCYEPPEYWEYLDDADIRALPDGATEKICAVFEELNRRFDFLYKE